jgi:hydroxymethylpyrimidine/phosphomethylpyrimidine kinase
MQVVPVALSVAGFDGSSGAGVTADCRTFNRMGVYGVSAVTAVVAQSPGSVSGFEMVSTGIFEKQLNEIIKSYPVTGAKTGMLGSAEIVACTATFFEANPEICLVVDPVLSASAGVKLSGESALVIMKQMLFPKADLLTPNLAEAQAILGIEFMNRASFCEGAKMIYEHFGCSCLLKGGHFLDDQRTVIDVFCDADGVSEILESPRLNLPDLHGTGCVLSAAITAGLARQLPLRDAVLNGRELLRLWMINHHTWVGGREVYALNGIDQNP